MNKHEMKKQLSEASGLLLQSICDRKEKYEVYRSVVVSNVREWLKGEQLLSTELNSGTLYQTYTNDKKVMSYLDPEGRKAIIPMMKGYESREDYLECAMDLAIQIIDNVIDVLEKEGK